MLVTPTIQELIAGANPFGKWTNDYLTPEDSAFNPKWTVHDENLFNPNMPQLKVDPAATAGPQGWTYTKGVGTFWSPFAGEFSTFPGDVQFDLLRYWFASQFNPGKTPHWSALVFGACWDQQGSSISAKSGGTWGNKSLPVTIPLLQAYGDTSPDNVQADVLHYDAAILGYDIYGNPPGSAPNPAGTPKTTRQCFLEGYGYRYLHPGPGVGQFALDVGMASLGVAAAVGGAIATGGVAIIGATAAAAAAAGGLINAAQASGVTVSQDVGNAALLFAHLGLNTAPVSYNFSGLTAQNAVNAPKLSGVSSKVPVNSALRGFPVGGFHQPTFLPQVATPHPASSIVPFAIGGLALLGLLL